MIRFFLSAGEISGDRYGAALVSALKHVASQRAVSEPRFVGMGGHHMRAVGVDLKWDVSDMSTIGFIEPLKYIPRFWRTYREIKAYLTETRPDIVIPIDFQGFNMAVCRVAVSLGIPVFYYIGPQFWQWGKASQAKAYLAMNCRTVTIFEEEQAYYRNMGANPVYIGHPLLDLLRDHHAHKPMPKAPFDLGLFPGSRPQEMAHTAPLLFAAAAALQRQPSCNENGTQVPTVSISVSNPRYTAPLSALAATSGLQNYRLVPGVPAELLSKCDLALATSGTMTLELALSGVPLVSVYRFHPVSYRIAKWLIGKKIKAMGHFSLPNLMLKTRLVPEFLQEEASVAAIVAAAENLLTNRDAHATIQTGYAKLRERLGSGGATMRAAHEIFQYLQFRNKG